MLFSLFCSKLCLKSNYSDRNLKTLDRQVIIWNIWKSGTHLITIDLNLNVVTTSFKLT